MNFATAPSYSIKGSGKKTIHQMTGSVFQSPGPMYNTFHLGQKTKSQSFAFGKSKRTNINYPIQNTPAPNNYKFSNPQSGIQNSFPQSKWTQKINVNPDPAFYLPNHNKIKEKILDFNMGSKYPSIMDDVSKNPGPGQYQQTASKLSQSRKTKFGSSKRFSYQKQTIPGPGDYQINSKDPMLKTSGHFTKGQRDANKPFQTPGPNSYAQYSFVDINNTKSIGKTMGGKLDGAINQKSLTKNSFGKYNIQSDKQRQNRTRSLGKMGKDQRSHSCKQLKPGVGRYHIGNYENKNSGRSFLDTAKYEQYLSFKQNPGPGAYNSSQKQSLKYTIPRAKSGIIVYNNPGVGRYKVTKGMQTARGWSMGKSNRTNFVSKNGAGVGDYNIINNNMGGISIPKAKRDKAIDKIPGPGDYHIQSTVANNNYYSKYVS